MHRVTSFKNPWIKLAIELRDRRTRVNQQLFLVEGTRELRRAAEAEIPVDFLIFCESRAEDPNFTAIVEGLQRYCRFELIGVPESIMERVCIRGTDSTAIAIAPMYSLELSKLPTPSNGLFVVADGFEKPGNLGTVLRSADAAGASGVIVCDEVTDLFNPNVVRASLGTVFCVPVARTTHSELVQWSRNHGISLVVASPESTTPYTHVDFTTSVGLVIGNEARGLGDEWSDSANEEVSIPQMGKVDSLNAAMAATVMLFEARRQRDQTSTNN